jgi:hypothetical protein
MSLGDVDKWVRGEVETFFAPHQKPFPSSSADCSHYEEMSTAQSVLPAEQPAVIPTSEGYNPLMMGAAFASIAATAAVVLVLLIIWTRPTAPPASSPAAADKLAPPAETLTKPPLDQLPSGAALDRIYGDMARWYDHTTKVTSAPEGKRSPTRRASRRHHWPPVRDRAERGEAARLMQAELRQMGITPARRHQRNGLAR